MFPQLMDDGKLLTHKCENIWKQHQLIAWAARREPAQCVVRTKNGAAPTPGRV